MNKLFNLLLAVVISAMTLAPAAQADTPARIDGKAAFESLTALAGTWDGKVTEGEDAVRVIFEVTSGGSVVLERLFAGSPHEMLNVYHLVDGDLRLVHYCSKGNQPMMKLDTAASRPGDLVFAFAGGTSFDPAKDDYISSARLRFDGERMDGEWFASSAGKDVGAMRFQARRTAGGTSVTPAPHQH